MPRRMRAWRQIWQKAAHNFRGDMEAIRKENLPTIWEIRTELRMIRQHIAFLRATGLEVQPDYTIAELQWERCQRQRAYHMFRKPYSWREYMNMEEGADLRLSREQWLELWIETQADCLAKTLNGPYFAGRDDIVKSCAGRIDVWRAALDMLRPQGSWLAVAHGGATIRDVG